MKCSLPSHSFVRFSFSGMIYSDNVFSFLKYSIVLVHGKDEYVT